MSDERSAYKEPRDTGGLVPPGWFLMDHDLRPDPTLKGYIDRNQSVYGKCVGKDCQRKASLDMRELLRITGPNLHLSKIAAYMRCARLEGCRFTFTSLEPRCNIPLERFVGHRNVRLRLRCGHCFSFTHREVASVIAWLEKSGRGSELTHIDAVERMLEAKCGCGARKWELGVVIFDVTSGRWREQGEGVFVDRPWGAKGR